MFERLTGRGYQIATRSHAEAILRHDFPEAVAEIEEVLLQLTLPVLDLLQGGGGEGRATQWLRRTFAGCGWRKHRFEVRKPIDDVERESISHEVDHVRDLEGFKLALAI